MWVSTTNKTIKINWKVRIWESESWLMVLRLQRFDSLDVSQDWGRTMFLWSHFKPVEVHQFACEKIQLCLLQDCSSKPLRISFRSQIEFQYEDACQLKVLVVDRVGVDRVGVDFVVAKPFYRVFSHFEETLFLFNWQTLVFWLLLGFIVVFVFFERFISEVCFLCHSPIVGWAPTQ